MMRFTFVLINTFVIAIVAAALCPSAHGANAEAVDDAGKSVCELPKEVGPCRKSDPVFYHNAATKQCEEFLYGGCLGNENRFDTKEDCERTCSLAAAAAAAPVAAVVKPATVVEAAANADTTTAN